MFIWLLSKWLNLIGYQGDKKERNFRKNVKKNLLLETVRWMKLILFIQAYGTILYINCVFVSVR